MRRVAGTRVEEVRTRWTSGGEPLSIGTMKTGTKLGILALVVAVSCVAAWNYHIGQVDIPENRTLFVAAFLTAVALGVAAFVEGKRLDWRRGGRPGDPHRAVLSVHDGDQSTGGRVGCHPGGGHDPPLHLRRRPGRALRLRDPPRAPGTDQVLPRALVTVLCRRVAATGRASPRVRPTGRADRHRLRGHAEGDSRGTR